MLGHHQDAGETPLKWRFASGPMMVRFQWYFDHLSSHQLKNNKKKHNKKTLSKLNPSDKISGSAHDWDVKYQLKLEDLKVLRRSPDLFNNVKIGQGQLLLIIKHILFYNIWGLQPFWTSDLKQSNEYPIKQLSDF